MNDSWDDTIQRLLVGVADRHQQLNQEANDATVERPRQIEAQERLSTFEEGLRQLHREVAAVDSDTVERWLMERSLEE